VLLFWNEGRAVQTARSLTEGAGLVVSVGPDKVDPANEGKLIHINGDVKTTAALTDPEFGVSAQGIRLVRIVEMYQWKEQEKKETRKNMGGSEETITTYTYVRTWSENRIDSGQFHQRDGHQNPDMRYRRFETTARDATLGAFRPGGPVLAQLSADTNLRVDPSIAASVRQRINSPAHVTDGVLFLGADPAQPRLGDLRVSYRTAPTGAVSIIGRQTGTDFAEYQTQAGDKLLIVHYGSQTAADMFKQAQQENTIITWVLRLVGIIVMFIGFSLVFRPLVVLGDVVPLIGSIIGAGVGIVAGLLTAVLAPIVIAIAWFWYRPLVSIIVLVIGGAAAFGLKMLATRRRAAQPATATGPA
jgi:hypothetical protein